MLESWNPPLETSAAEKKLLKLSKKQKLWSFLRHHRHRLLDEEMRAAIRGMYAESGRGRGVCPERLALALILQTALHVSDQEVPVLTGVDRRWKMVLDCLDAEVDEAAFSQGTVFHFRERARTHGLMRRLLDKTVELARESKGYSHKKLRAMIDSSPLMGAGRVEDSFNLIGRAIAKLAEVTAHQAGRKPEALAKELSLSVVSAKSVKAALDVDWRLSEARTTALTDLLEQFSRLRLWLEQQFPPQERSEPPISDALALVEELIEQDTEPDPEGPKEGNRRRIKQKAGGDRRISISDPDMRHGRKSKTKPFAGFKRHVLMDADVPGLVVGVRVVPANEREFDACGPILDDAEKRGFQLTELHFDRGYLPAEAIHERRRKGMTVISKPYTPPKKNGRFNKSDFTIDTENRTVRCPANKETQVTPSGQAVFNQKTCHGCSLSDQCLPPSGRKTVKVHKHEELHQQMAKDLATPQGRRARRKRTLVEHTLARVGAVQGRRAKFRGQPKNQFHSETAAVVANLYVLNQLTAAA